jgi:rhamnogalacturonyl hydrolase YesR
LLYYYLTGYDRALDVAKETGEFFLKHPITYFKHPDIAPHRAMANILMGELALYEATGDDRLKKDADYWANMFFQGQNRNGSFNENYNPRDKRWDGDPHNGYMSGYTLPALIDYHKTTGNPAIKEAIVKLTDYLVKHNEYADISEGLAYSYFLTGDNKYLEAMEKRLEFMLSSQKTQNDPLWNGMIYQKLYYERVAEFLFFTPFAFEALLAAQNEKKDQS